MLGFILPTTVLISRPPKDAEVLERAVLSMDRSAKTILAPAIVIDHVTYNAQIEVFDAIVLTSKHAVAAAKKIAGNKPVLCVGDTTAQVARDLGLEAMSAGGAAKELIALVLRLGVSRVLYLRGEHVHADLELELRSAGIETNSRIVYRQNSCLFSSDTQRTISIATALLIPIYSTRSAKIVSENLEGFKGQITLIAISKSAAMGWSGSEPHKIVYAYAPNSEAMLTAIASHLA